MARDLRPRGPVAVVQLPAEVFPGLGDEGENRLITLLSFILRVVALARPHLLPVERVHGRIGVQRDPRQLHVGCFPDPFLESALQLQQLLGDGHRQGGQETLEGTLRRQFPHLHDSDQHGILRHETKMIKSGETHVERQHHPQQELLDGHHAGNAMDG